jgi:alkanesulfonate monooxygenase
VTINFHWFLPTSGDSRNVVPGSGGHGRPPSLDYLAQIARAADHLGFDAVLTPTGTHCEDAWLVTAALSQHTSRLRFLVAFRPGITNPTLAAQQAATFQRLTGGRLLINIVTGGDNFEQRRFGDWLSHDERYARTDEFMAILRGAWSGEPFNYGGWHYKVRGATVLDPPDPYLRCSSAAQTRWPAATSWWWPRPPTKRPIPGSSRHSSIATATMAWPAPCAFP